MYIHAYKFVQKCNALMHNFYEIFQDWWHPDLFVQPSCLFINVVLPNVQT